MSDLVRFGVAMDRGLLEEFDRRIAKKGYENRSEALRDLVRADLTRAAWDGGANVAGSLTIVYSTKQAEHVAGLLAEAPRAHPSPIVASTRTALDGGRTMEVVLLSGAAASLTELTGRIGGARGVLSAELAIACAASDLDDRDDPSKPRGDRDDDPTRAPDAGR